MFGSRVHEDLLAEGDYGDPNGDNSGTEVNQILGLVLVMNLKEGNFNESRKLSPLWAYLLP